MLIMGLFDIIFANVKYYNVIEIAFSFERLQL